MKRPEETFRGASRERILAEPSPSSAISSDIVAATSDKRVDAPKGVGDEKGHQAGCGHVVETILREDPACGRCPVMLNGA